MSMTAAWNQTAGHRHWISRRHCALHVALSFDSSSFEYDFDFKKHVYRMPAEPLQGSPNIALKRHQKGPDASFRTQSGAYFPLGFTFSRAWSSLASSRVLVHSKTVGSCNASFLSPGKV
jgi:hypothetical protein